MIIGINGKIGSGKDTIGEIIQGLCLTNKGQVFEIKKFAGKLKQIGSILSGIPVEKFEDQDFKKTNLEKNWDVKSKYRDRRHPTPMTVREFLQKLGTEAMRDGLHTNVWVNALFADYNSIDKLIRITEEGLEEWEEGNYPNWIITDMRFPNEMEAVVERKGITIRVVRYPKTVEQSRGPENIETVPFDPTNHKHMSLWKGNLSRLHASETALDDAEFDYEIINDGTIEDLIDKVREILTKENII
jgi:hypothetical protein